MELSAFAIGTQEITNYELCVFLNAEGNQRDRGVPWAETRKAPDFSEAFGSEPSRN